MKACYISSVILGWIAGALLAASANASEPQPLVGITGVDLRNIREDITEGEYFNYPLEEGVLVRRVYAGGPAERTGIRPHDILVRSGKSEFESTGEFIAWLKTTKHGEKYPLSIWRLGDDYEWTQVDLVYRAEWGISEKPIAPGSAWDGPLTAYLDESVIYIANNGQYESWTDVDDLVSVRFNGKQPVEGFFEVDGKATRLIIATENRDILAIATPADIEAEIEQLERQMQQGKGTASTAVLLEMMKEGQELQRRAGGLRYEFLEPGKATITVTVADRKVQLSLTLVQAPVTPEVPSDEVVDKLGLPDHRLEVYVKWPNSEIVDGILYKPSVSEGSLTASHWRYDEYPGLVLSIQDGMLKQFNTDSNGVPESEEESKRPEGMRTWTSKSGHTTEAIFVGYKRGRVSLKNAEGKTTEVRLADLSSEDRKFVQEQVKAAKQAELEEGDD